jgi:hypothetical protein
MNARNARFWLRLLLLVILLAAFTHTAFAAPWDFAPTVTAPPPPSTEPTTAAPVAGSTDVTDDSDPATDPTTTRWETPTDEEGNTLFPTLPTTTTKATTPTTTKKTTTKSPFSVNPAHPDDRYTGALWYNRNPDLYDTVTVPGEEGTEEETTTTVASTTTAEQTTEWTLPEPEDRGLNLRLVIGIAAGALLLLALAVAVAVIAKGGRERREARRVAPAPKRPNGKPGANPPGGLGGQPRPNAPKLPPFARRGDLPANEPPSKEESPLPRLWREEPAPQPEPQAPLLNPKRPPENWNDLESALAPKEPELPPVTELEPEQFSLKLKIEETPPARRAAGDLEIQLDEIVPFQPDDGA